MTEYFSLFDSVLMDYLLPAAELAAATAYTRQCQEQKEEGTGAGFIQFLMRDAKRGRDRLYQFWAQFVLYHGQDVRQLHWAARLNNCKLAVSSG